MLIFLFTLLALMKDAGIRYDGSPSLPYYSAEDFSLDESRFSFVSNGYRIYGSRYKKKGVKIKALIVFFHGIGAGRTAYMNVIERLCADGYLVYAYDNLGSMQSEGRGYKGLGECANEQEAFFSFLDKDEEAHGLTRFAMGHSWGGYAALLAMQKRYNVAKAVSLSGFLQPESEILALIPRFKNPLVAFFGRFAIRLYYGKKRNIDALKIVKESEASLLYIQKKGDPVVPYVVSGKILEKECAKLSNVELLLIEGEGHSPYLTDRAESYTNAYLKEHLHDIASEKHPSLDIKKACEINEGVYKRIIDFLSH